MLKRILRSLACLRLDGGILVRLIMHIGNQLLALAEIVVMLVQPRRPRRGRKLTSQASGLVKNQVSTPNIVAAAKMTLGRITQR